MTEPGIDADGIAQTEADHHMKCPGCGEWFDMRDLGQVLAHVHDAEIEIERRSYVVTRSRRLN
jgi:CRISPR/Cas system type I-B associated protein Csh2 (Cas7 group RAMP superfamily)